jgi:hypothetical protein
VPHIYLYLTINCFCRTETAYVFQEREKLISEADVDVMLAQAALVNFKSREELQAITFQRVLPKAIHLSTVFTRGVTTVLLLLSACGCDIKEGQNLTRL